jgi:hypothetical protein
MSLEKGKLANADSHVFLDNSWGGLLFLGIGNHRGEGAYFSNKNEVSGPDHSGSCAQQAASKPFFIDAFLFNLIQLLP